MIRLWLCISCLFVSVWVRADIPVKFNHQYTLKTGGSLLFELPVIDEKPYLISISQNAELSLKLIEADQERIIKVPYHTIRPIYFIHHKHQQSIVITTVDPNAQDVTLTFSKQPVSELQASQWNIGLGILERLALTEYEEALNQLLAVLNSPINHDDTLKGVYLLLMNSVRMNLGQFDDALSVLRELKAVASEEPKMLSYIYAYQARINSIKGNKAQAILLYKQSLKINQQLNDQEGMASDLNNIGLTYHLLGKLSVAMAYYQKAQVIWLNMGDLSRQLKVMNNMAGVHFMQGDVATARDMYRQAIETARTNQLLENLANLLEMQAWLFESQGEFEHLLTQWQEVIALRMKLNDKVGLIRAYRLLGRSHYHMGDWAMAKQYLTYSVEQAESITLTETYGVTLKELAAVYQALNEWQEAEKFYQRAFDFNHSKNNPYYQAGDHLALADFYRMRFGHSAELEHLSKGKQHAQKAMEIYSQSKHLHQQSKSQLVLLQINFLINKSALKTDELKQMMNLAKDKGWLSIQFGLTELQANLLSAEGNKIKAINTRNEALNLLALQSKQVKTPRLRALFRAQQHDVVEAQVADMVFLYQNSGDVDWKIKALAMSEQAKSVAMKEVSNFKKDLTIEQAELQDKLNTLYFLKKDLLNKPHLSQVELKGIQENILKTKSELDSLGVGDSIQRLDWRTSLNTARIKSIQASMEHQDRVLAYRLSSNDSWRWVISKNTIDVEVLPNRKTIEQHIQTVYDFYSQPHINYNKPTEQVKLSLGWLKKHVLFDLDDWNDVQKVTISTDGLLALFPWGLIQKNNTALSLTPSFMFSKHKVNHQNRQLLAVVNPSFNPDRYAPLPMTQYEADFLTQQLGADHVTVLSQSDATQSKLRKALENNPATLHIATHGVINAEWPELSALVLAPEQNKSGFLRLSDIGSLPLNGQTVVLSACETALGEYIRGEGLMGLSHAFFVAGANKIHATLWQISDREAMRTVKNMYSINELSIDSQIKHPAWVTYELLE